MSVLLGSSGASVILGSSGGGVVRRVAADTLTHGASYVINGSGFGTKATAAPLVWENFDAGTLHASLDNHGLTAFNNTTGLRHANSTYHAYADFAVAGGQRGWASYNGSTAPKWFVQYWVKLATGWPWGGAQFTPLSNVKFMRFFPGGSDTYANLGYSWQSFNGGTLRFIENGTSTYKYGIQFDDLITTNVWHCIQCAFADSSGVDVADGVLKLWIDGVEYDSTTTLITDPSFDGAASLKRPYIIGMYDSNSPAGSAADAYYTDLYVDNAWSRVEIGNNAVYGSCTHREVQIPTAWSDTSITVTVNKGSFASGGAYLFVIDNTDTVQALGAVTLA